MATQSPRPGERLKAQLGERRALLVPGATNALAARIIADFGFAAVYVSGAGVTNAFLGLPDLGFISLAELAQHTVAIRGDGTLWAWGDDSHGQLGDTATNWAGLARIGPSSNDSIALATA